MLKKYLESELVVLLKAGNEPAFEELFKRYEHQVFLYALKFTKSLEAAEELQQDVFVKLWDYRSKIDLSLSFNALLFKIAKNHILNYIRNDLRQNLLRKEFSLTMETTRNLTEEKIFWDEYIQIIQQAIDNLPSQRKSIFVLSRFEDKSYDEIANLLSISKDTVRNQMVKSLKSVRQYIQLKTDIRMGIILCFIFS